MRNPETFHITDNDRITEEKIQELRDYLDMSNKSNTSLCLMFAEDIFTSTRSYPNFRFMEKNGEEYLETDHYSKVSEIFDIILENPNHLFIFTTGIFLEFKYTVNKEKYFSLNGVKTFLYRYSGKKMGLTGNDEIDKKLIDEGDLKYFNYKHHMPNMYVGFPIERPSEIKTYLEAFLYERNGHNKVVRPLMCNTYVQYFVRNKYIDLKKPKVHRTVLKEGVASDTVFSLGDLVSWAVITIPDNIKYNENRLKKTIAYFTDKNVPIWVNSLGENYYRTPKSMEFCAKLERALDSSKDSLEKTELKTVLSYCKSGTYLEVFPKFCQRELPSLP